MSEYLGWKDSKPRDNQFVSKQKFDRDILPGGPMTNEYEDFVKNIFRGGPIPAEGQESLGTEAPKLSAANMMKMEQHFGKHALDDSNDYDILQSPLSNLYSELGISEYDPDKKTSTYKQYPVYTPKSSSEYFSTLLEKHGLDDEQSSSRTRSYREQFDDEWKKSNRQHLVDYKDFHSAPLSPYMYQSHNAVQRQDSRIVGSNFVQVTTRPKDNFLDKVDKLLADVRAMPRY